MEGLVESCAVGLNHDLADKSTERLKVISGCRFACRIKLLTWTLLLIFILRHASLDIKVKLEGLEHLKDFLLKLSHGFNLALGPNGRSRHLSSRCCRALCLDHGLFYEVRFLQ